MTKAELEFYERMPRLMHQLVEELNKVTAEVAKLTAEVKELKENNAK